MQLYSPNCMTSNHCRIVSIRDTMNNEHNIKVEATFINHDEYTSYITFTLNIK